MSGTAEAAKAAMITLVVLYAPMPSSSRKSDSPALPPVRIRMDREQAEQIVEHRRGAMATIAPFTGRDADHRPFNIDVGSRAVAVYCEDA